MAARGIIAGVIVLIVIAALVVAAMFGLGSLQQSSPASNAGPNITINATTGMLPAAATPSSTPAAAPVTPAPSGQQLAVAQGQTFTIRLSANPSTGYHWEPTFDPGALSLRSQMFVSNTTSGQLVGVGGTDLFTLQALRTGTTSVTFDYISPGGQTTQSTSYTVTVR